MELSEKVTEDAFTVSAPFAAEGVTCQKQGSLRPGHFGCIDSAHHTHSALKWAHCLATVTPFR